MSSNLRWMFFVKLLCHSLELPGHQTSKRSLTLTQFKFYTVQRRLYIVCFCLQTWLGLSCRGLFAGGFDKTWIVLNCVHWLSDLYIYIYTRLPNDLKGNLSWPKAFFPSASQVSCYLFWSVIQSGVWGHAFPRVTDVDILISRGQERNLLAPRESAS